MLFDKDIRPSCALCENGVQLDDDRIMCRKKGPVGPLDSCRHFKYDPLLRKPSRPAPLKTSFDEDDFKL